jgi:hypothetical protein
MFNFDKVAAKFNMAAAKPEVVVSLVPDAILAPFQRLYDGVFRVLQFNVSAPIDFSVKNNVHLQQTIRSSTFTGRPTFGYF